MNILDSCNKQSSILPSQPLNYKLIRNSTLNRLIWNIMGRCLPVQGNEKIVITGQILGDGKGDWVGLSNQQRTLQDFDLDKEVRIIACSSKKWEGKLDTSKIKKDMLDLAFYGEATTLGISVPLSAFHESAKIQKKLEQADLIIEGGVSLLAKDILDKEKMIKIYEHDFRTADSSWNINFDTKLQTGIGCDSLGVFTCSPKKYTWHEIENDRLKSVLFNTTNPSDDEINNYSANHHHFFNYMSEFENRMKFAEDMACFTKPVDICLPNIFSQRYCENMEIGFNEYGLSVIKYHISHIPDISQVKIIWFNGDEKKEQIIQLRDEGHELRLIDPGSLSAKDFKRMISVSGPFVGCTGDNSLAQVISYGKVPYYEPRFEAKSKALRSRILADCTENSELYKFISGKCMKYIEPNEHIEFHELNIPNLVKEAKSFGEKIRENSSFQYVLRGVVNEKLLRQKDQDFADKEDKICQDYLDTKITIDDFKTQLTDLLKEKGLIAPSETTSEKSISL